MHGETLTAPSHWNATRGEYPRNVPLASLIEAVATRTPNARAVTFGDVTVSYAELDAQSNRLARELQLRGAGPDVLVGVAVERSIEMVVALLAVVKAGAAYVPLDPRLPRERVEYKMQDSGLAILITQSSVRERLPSFAGAVVDLEAPGWQAHSAGPVSTTASGVDLAYVMYTSGSTGRPKGVEITRASLANLLSSMQEWLAPTASDRFLALTTISFDISGVEIWLPLIAGAELVVATRDAAADGERLRSLIAQHDITVLQATPVTWHQLLSTGWTGKRDMQALCAAEAMPIEIAHRLAPIVKRLWNLYGPTETTIYSTGTDVRPGIKRVSIGRPIANTRCHILDEQLQPVADGAIGELYIAGDGLARGYLNRPELTAEKFVADPFSGVAGARMYRTGDLARFLADGAIQCLGRTDDQIKLRGLRIEPGEIESALRKNTAVDQAVVVAREDVPGEKRLIAYVVPRNGAIALTALRASVRQTLPEYMVPAVIIPLSALPLTTSGKVDRRALPAPPEHAPSAETEFVSPRTHAEHQLAEVWSDIFNISTVGVTANFFDLGGDSMLAVTLMARIASVFGKELPINALIESPTVAQLAKHIEDASRTLGAHSLVPIQATGSRPPLFWIPGGAALGLFRLRPLVTRFGPDQPVFGLGSSAPASLADVETVEQRATKYVELVRRVQPTGPYCVVGFCAGGLVAFEMARQLTAAGEHVGFVGLIDAPYPQYPSGRLARWLARAQRLRHRVRDARGRGVSLAGFVRATLASRRDAKLHAKQLAAESRRVEETGLKQGEVVHNELLLKATARIFDRYHPRRYQGAISLFVSNDPEFAGTSIDLDPRFAWRRIVDRADVVRYSSGGGHTTNLDEADAFVNDLSAAFEASGAVSSREPGVTHRTGIGLAPALYELVEHAMGGVELLLLGIPFA